MPVIYLLIMLVIIGFLLWLVDNYVPMNDFVKKIFYAVVVIAMVLWLLNEFGILAGLSSYHLR